MSIEIESYCQTLLSQIQDKWGDGKRNQTLIGLNGPEKQHSSEIAEYLNRLLSEAYPESSVEVTVDGFRRLVISQN